MTALNRPLQRKSSRPFLHYRKGLVITLLPGDVLSLRLVRERRHFDFDLHSLYYQAVRRAVAANKHPRKRTS